MKLFIVVAFCVVASMALPVDETKQTQDESQLTLLELDPSSDESFEDSSRVKRHYGGQCFKNKNLKNNLKYFREKKLKTSEKMKMFK